MFNKEFKIQTKWSSLKDAKDFESFSNSKTHSVFVDGKDPLTISAAKDFKGDATKHNPEDLFLAAISSCHMMSYMYLCVKHKITIVDYNDEASGKLRVNNDGSGGFISVQLYPIVTILEKNEIDLAFNLHKEANRLCFIANSSSVPITHTPQILIAN